MRGGWEEEDGEDTPSALSGGLSDSHPLLWSMFQIDFNTVEFVSGLQSIVVLLQRFVWKKFIVRNIYKYKMKRETFK